MKTRIFTSLAIALLLIAMMVTPAVADSSGTLGATVTLNSDIDMTITDGGGGGIAFGNVDLGAQDVLDTTTSSGSIASVTINVVASTVGNVDLFVSGTDFDLNFPVSAAKYDDSYPAVSTTDMSTSDTEFASDIAESGSASLWFWLDVPSSGVNAQLYSSTFTFSAQATS